MNIPGLFSIATVFASNYNGSEDKDDNGEGAFTDLITDLPYATRFVVGVSLPIPILQATFGSPIPYREISLGAYTVDLQLIRTGQLYDKIPIVDLGPGEPVHGQHGLLEDTEGNLHLLDRTLPLCKLMASDNDEKVLFWINGPQGHLLIKGLNAPKKII
jgi:hypothetical protein